MTRERLGGHHSARSVMVSGDFAEIQPLTERNDWDGVLAILLRAAQASERADADLLLLITQAQTRIPLFDTTEIHARAAADSALAEMK